MSRTGRFLSAGEVHDLRRRQTAQQTHQPAEAGAPDTAAAVTRSVTVSLPANRPLTGEEIFELRRQQTIAAAGRHPAGE